MQKQSNLTVDDLIPKMRVIIQQSNTAVMAVNKSIHEYLKAEWDAENEMEFADMWKETNINWLYPEGKELNQAFFTDCNDTVDADLFFLNISKLMLDADNRFKRLTVGFNYTIKQLEENIRLEGNDKLLPIFKDIESHINRVQVEINALIETMYLQDEAININTLLNTTILINATEENSTNLENETLPNIPNIQKNEPFNWHAAPPPYRWILLREFRRQLKYLMTILNYMQDSSVHCTVPEN